MHQEPISNHEGEKRISKSSLIFVAKVNILKRAIVKLTFLYNKLSRGISPWIFLFRKGSKADVNLT